MLLRAVKKMGRVGFRKQIPSVDCRRSVRDVLRQIFGQSCFVSVDNDFGLSEGDTSDQEGVGNSLYLRTPLSTWTLPYQRKKM